MRKYTFPEKSFSYEIKEELQLFKTRQKGFCPYLSDRKRAYTEKNELNYIKEIVQGPPYVLGRPVTSIHFCHLPKRI